MWHATSKFWYKRTEKKQVKMFVVAFGVCVCVCVKNFVTEVSEPDFISCVESFGIFCASETFTSTPINLVRPAENISDWRKCVTDGVCGRL